VGARESKNESERVKDLAELAEFNKKRLTNDPSKKNLSSIVFIARIPPRDGFPEWSGLFTGDASAQTIFSVKENMKQLPLELDLLKGYCKILIRR
jgi:hypothetical protein